MAVQEYSLKHIGIARNVFEASYWRALKSSVCFVDLGGTAYNLSSGTLLAVKDRLFVITAGHTIPKDDAAERLWLLRQAGGRSDARPKIVNHYATHEDAWPDLGVLELELHGYSEYDKEKALLGLDDLALLGPGSVAHGSFVCGAPQELTPEPTKSIERDASGTYRCLGFHNTIMQYCEMAIPPESWPKAYLTNDLSKEIDILLDYPSDETLEEEGYVPAKLPRPHGMSGGGIWDPGVAAQGDLWTSANCKLFGIQVQYLSQRRYLRGIQMHIWLRQFAEWYPELADCVYERFHALAP